MVRPSWTLRVTLFCLAAAPLAAVAATTLPAGQGATFDNTMPSVGLRYLINVDGGSAEGLGEVALFTPRTARPTGWLDAEGQLLSVDDHADLFAKLGDTFGGDGIETFALPDMRGRTAIGAGQGAGLPDYPIGFAGGSEDAFLQSIPAHSHPLGSGLVTSTTEPFAGNGSHSNLQPSLALTPIIATQGAFPSRSLIALATADVDRPAEIGTGGNDPYLGEITWIAHDEIPEGWARADGSLLDISSNSALFSILGIQYGGDGRRDFALPDLRGRAAVGHSNAQRVGNQAGTLIDELDESHLPVHSHALPGGGETGPAGAAQSQSNVQPTLAITQAVSHVGVFPPTPASAAASTSGDEEITPAELGHTDPYLGSVMMFAGNFAPRGFFDAEGQLLPINQHTALFALTWDTYGGNAQSTFALPDLRSRLAVGVGEGNGLTPRSLGGEFGEAATELLVENLPEHTHGFSIPGDYNDDGRVDAADYTVWRDNLGAAEGTLPNDPDGGDIGTAQYNTWTANYGLPGAEATPSSAVPEPTSLLLLAAAALAGLGRKHD